MTEGMINVVGDLIKDGAESVAGLLGAFGVEDFDLAGGFLVFDLTEVFRELNDAIDFRTLEFFLSGVKVWGVDNFEGVWADFEAADELLSERTMGVVDDADFEGDILVIENGAENEKENEGEEEGEEESGFVAEKTFSDSAGLAADADEVVGEGS